VSKETYYSVKRKRDSGTSANPQGPLQNKALGSHGPEA